jgi:hypothetical protein
MTAYNEPSKNKARSLVIETAIKTLTSERNSATLARRSYVRDVRDHIIENGTKYDVPQAKALQDTTIDRWESFYDSITQSRSPANLKVAYLAGPNPENDLRVFCNAGLLPENIWAFESEKETYLKAVSSALTSEFPFIKIIHGGIDSFLEASPQRFDIIYLDFCGPLPSRNNKQKTLNTITQLLAKHSLNSPGIFTTNVALPTKEQDSIGRELLSKLVACYLYPKDFLEDNQSEQNFVEGAIAHGYDHREWIEMVRADLDQFYGQFVTRLIMDHASFISPYDRFPSHNVLFKRFFKIDNKQKLQALITDLYHFNEEYGGGDVITDAGSYPILWTLAALDKKLNAKDVNYPQYVHEDLEFQRFSELFLRQLSVTGNKVELIENISKMSFLLSEGSLQSKFLSENLSALSRNHSFRDFYNFCDLVLFHQIMELLFRQVAFPYHVNVEKTKRWTYQAKDTPMFMDMIVLDECRYLYDWMPTSDRISYGISDSQRQLAYRFALDGVSKHRRWYNPEYFSGTAVVDQFTENFEAKTLMPRENIN